MLALGRALREAGWPVALLANPAFAQTASDAGLQFVPVGELKDQCDTLSHPKLWHPIDGFGVMWRYMLRPALRPTYQQLAALAAEGPCVVIASPVAMGARIAQERLGLPLITAYTAATMLRTVEDPMTLAQWRVAPWFPRALRSAAWALLDRHKLEPLVRPALDALRGELGMAPLRESVFGRWMHSPQAGVALFPAWFAAAAKDWPSQVVQAGFPLFDEDVRDGLSPDLAHFLASGRPPVVFMPGTARERAADFFAAAVQACEQAGERGLLLGAVDPDLRQRLPSSIHAESYVPFGSLLRRTGALVHHGGIGSAAQALRAGIPQLVAPHAYDQFDNAMRLERLGVGRTLRSDASGLQAMGAQLKALLASAETQAACTRWAPQVTANAARDTVISLVERLA
jgi:rhamnosyltransferase subunit B